MWHSLLLLVVLNICCSLTDWCYVFLLQELLFPCIELGKQLKLLVDWEDPFKSHAVLVLILFIVYRYCNLFWQADTPLALNYSKLKFCKSLILCDEYDLTRVIYMTPSERNWSEWKSMLIASTIASRTPTYVWFIYASLDLRIFFVILYTNKTCSATSSRGWIRYILPCIFFSCAAFMLWQKHNNHGKPIDAFEIAPPPSRNPVEQLLTLPELVSKLETNVQAGSIVLLKLRAIMFAAFPQVWL